MDDFLEALLTGILVIVYGVSLYGWGRVGERIVGIRWPAAITVSIGVAVILFVGGVANMASLAYAETLDGLAFIGILVAAIDFAAYRKCRQVDAERIGAVSRYDCFVGRSMALGLMTVVFAFVTITQVPPGAVNFHDDLETYLLFPVHMLAQGSVDTGPFSNIGIVSLGGMAFLHGFVLAHWPLATVNAVDSLFGLLLCMGMVYAVGARLNLPIWLVLLTMAGVVFIDPQYVNVSTIYLAAALVMLIAFVPLGNSVATSEEESKASTRRAAIVGLAYAAAVSLKMTFFLPLLVHFIVSSSAVALACRSLKDGFAWALKVGGFGLLGILPWVLTVAESRFANVFTVKRTAEVGIPVPEAEPPLPSFLSNDPIRHGFGTTSYLHYTTLILFVVLIGLTLTYRAYQRDKMERFEDVWQIAVCFFLPIFFFLWPTTIGRYIMSQNANLRYIVPIVIGTFPAVVLFFAHSIRKYGAMAARPGESPKLRRSVIVGLPVTVAILIFLQPLVGRVYQAVSAGSVLGFEQFARKPAYIEFSAYALSDAPKRELAEIQSVVPEGAKIIAISALPFHLDFRRNEVLPVHGAGLGWLFQDFPFGEDAQAAKRYFKSRGIDYILWQREGYSVRDVAHYEYRLRRANRSSQRLVHNAIDFIETLRELSNSEETVYSGPKFTLLKLN